MDLAADMAMPRAPSDGPDNLPATGREAGAAHQYPLTTSLRFLRILGVRSTPF
jgi:hypothetical protein